MTGSSNQTLSTILGSKENLKHFQNSENSPGEKRRELRLNRAEDGLPPRVEMAVRNVDELSSGILASKMKQDIQSERPTLIWEVAVLENKIRRVVIRMFPKRHILET